MCYFRTNGLSIFSILVIINLIKFKMKKSLLLLLVAFMSVGSLMAQDKITDSDYCTFQDDTVVQYVDGKPTTISSAVTLKDGTSVSPDGSYTCSKGKFYKLKDGECLGASGKKYKSEEALFAHLQKAKKKLLSKMKK